MVIDHIGIVVRSLEEAAAQWQTLFGYAKSSAVVLNTRQKVRVLFLSKKDSLPVKLIEPVSPDSPVYGFAKRGGGLHHLRFRCGSLQAEIPRLEQAGAMLKIPPEPGEAFQEHPIAFLLARNNLNLELIDRPRADGPSQAANPQGH